MAIPYNAINMNIGHTYPSQLLSQLRGRQEERKKRKKKTPKKPPKRTRYEKLQLHVDLGISCR